MGFEPPRPSAILGAKSPVAAVHVRNQLKHRGLVLLLHACLLRRLYLGTACRECTYSLTRLKTRLNEDSEQEQHVVQVRCPHLPTPAMDCDQAGNDHGNAGRQGEE